MSLQQDWNQLITFLESAAVSGTAACQLFATVRGRCASLEASARLRTDRHPVFALKQAIFVTALIAYFCGDNSKWQNWLAEPEFSHNDCENMRRHTMSFHSNNISIKGMLPNRLGLESIENLEQLDSLNQVDELAPMLPEVHDRLTLIGLLRSIIDDLKQAEHRPNTCFQLSQVIIANTISGLSSQTYTPPSSPDEEHKQEDDSYETNRVDEINHPQRLANFIQFVAIILHDDQRSFAARLFTSNPLWEKFTSFGANLRDPDIFHGYMNTQEPDTRVFVFDGSNYRSNDQLTLFVNTRVEEQKKSNLTTKSVFER